MKLHFSRYFLCLIALFLFTRCGSDDVEPVPGIPGTITADINGDPFSAGEFFAAAELFEEPDNSYSLSVTGIRVEGINTETISVGLFGIDFENVRAGDVFRGNDLERLFIGVYTNTGSNVLIAAQSELVGDNFCTVTKIDHVNKTISGTFTYQAVNSQVPGQLFNVTNGVFTDMVFD